jgi:glycosyltransferase involved in cell wall biosynthesis
MVFYGTVAPAETDGLRGSFDVLLAPYHRPASDPAASGHTPWLSPLKLMEYMASGKPIVCSDLPAYREVLSDEQTALLCDPDDVQSWRLAMQRLWDDPALRDRLGAAARAQFLNGNTWQDRARKVLGGLA